MRLIEAVVDANHRALAGDPTAGLRPTEHASELPLVALTCIDVRLNPLLPEVLGVPESDFIWLRNAGNIITGPMSSTMRSLALACAIKGGKEIAIIGHTDCRVADVTTSQLIDRFRELGVTRNALPDNLNEFFGTFASVRQNVIRSTEIARQSSLVGPKIPIHGLLVDIGTGKLEWLVNGYQALELAGPNLPEKLNTGSSRDALVDLPAFEIKDMQVPDSKIGDFASKVEDWLTAHELPAPQKPTLAPPEKASARQPAVPPPIRIPLPPPIRPKAHLKKPWK
jgi:carbonic anhydrase